MSYDQRLADCERDRDALQAQKAEVERIALWALDGVSMYLQCGAERTIRESVKAYVDKTRQTIREGQQGSEP